MPVASFIWGQPVVVFTAYHTSASPERTRVAVERRVLSPVPSWPKSLAPQAQTKPLASSARAWLAPAATATTFWSTRAFR